jgi:hypothetical protein
MRSERREHVVLQTAEAEQRVNRDNEEPKCV